MRQEGYTGPEFLPKEPDRALKKVRELLYERLEVLRTCILREEDRTPVDAAFLNEVDFISGVLDMIERS